MKKKKKKSNLAKALELGNYALMASLDLSSAFDMVDIRHTGFRCCGTCINVKWQNRQMHCEVISDRVAI